MKEKNEAIHEMVRESYTRAVTSGGGCCATAGGTSEDPTMKGVLVKSAGYSVGELAGIPADAVQNAFGCGNPLAFAGVQAGQVVLDIGSGAGIDCLLAAQRVGPQGRVIGLDMTPAMLEKARANAAAAGYTNVEFRKGEAESMPVDSGSVDWVISNCVINLSPDKESVFQEIARVLKPGGQVSISDLVAEDLPRELREHPVIYNSCLGGAISESEYVRKMEAAGLTEVRVVERMVYDAGQLEALVESETGEQLLSEQERRLADCWIPTIAGRVASVKVQARKP